MAAYRSSARVSSGTSPALIAIGILGVIAAVVVTIFLITADRQKQRDADAANTPVTTEETAENVFGDLPPDLPQGHTPQGVDDPKTKSPFDDIVNPTDNPVWVKAERDGDRGMDLVVDAMKALQSGDKETARKLGAQAQELITEAVHSTEKFETELIEKYGAKHTAVKRVIDKTSAWRRELMALKKSAEI